MAMVHAKEFTARQEQAHAWMQRGAAEGMLIHPHTWTLSRLCRDFGAPHGCQGLDSGHTWPASSWLAVLDMTWYVMSCTSRQGTRLQTRIACMLETPVTAVFR